MKKNTTFLLLLLIAQLAYAQAQYGHINYGTLLSVLPETKQADKDLEAYQVQLQDDLKAAVEKYKKRYIEINTAIQNGDLSPVQVAKFEEEIKQTENKLKLQELQISDKVGKKRQELLAPILDRAKKAIEAVARERGYVMVFDTSIFNAILSATEESDLMPYVLAKFGITYDK